MDARFNLRDAGIGIALITMCVFSARNQSKMVEDAYANGTAHGRTQYECYEKSRAIYEHSKLIKDLYEGAGEDQAIDHVHDVAIQDLRDRLKKLEDWKADYLSQCE